MPDFSNSDVWMENISAMREGDLLAIDTADDGQPLCSDTLIQNFIREMDDEASFEMQFRLLSGGRVAPAHRIKMLTAMVHAINKVCPQGTVSKENMQNYMFIISALKPFDQILFMKKWDQ